MQSNVDFVCMMGPGTKLEATCLCIKWPITKVETAQNRKLCWWYPKYFSIWIRKAVSIAILINRGTCSTENMAGSYNLFCSVFLLLLLPTCCTKICRAAIFHGLQVLVFPNFRSLKDSTLVFHLASSNTKITASVK